MHCTTSRFWIYAVVAVGCGGDDGGSGGGTGTMSTDGTTTMMTSATSPTTTESTTMSTSASTSATTESGSTDPTETSNASTGPDGSSSEPGSTGVDTTGDGSSGSDTNGMCAQMQESCLQASCCGNLDCCSGVPIPKGEAICLAQCPDSDRNIKTGFDAVDVDDVLDRVAGLPITTWSYMDEAPAVRHIGPMAQDFQATFGVGGSDRAIAKVDADGVALAAVQALHRRVATLQAENDALRDTVVAIQERLAQLEAR